MERKFNLKPLAADSKGYHFLWIKLEKMEVYKSLYGISAVVMAVGLAILFPQKNCTCEDQVTDPRLEALAHQGDKRVVQYLQARESVISCVAKRDELLKMLVKREADQNKKKNRANRY